MAVEWITTYSTGHCCVHSCK